jgi:hypothetical protein
MAKYAGCKHALWTKRLQGGICRESTHPVNFCTHKIARQTMPGVNMLCYSYCKAARVHRWNDVPLIDATPGNVSPINMIDRGPAPSRPCSVSLHYTGKWPVTCHECDRPVLSVSTARIDCWYRVNNGQYRPRFCQTHISGAFAHVFADAHRQFCATNCWYKQTVLHNRARCSVSRYLQCAVSAMYF